LPAVLHLFPRRCPEEAPVRAPLLAAAAFLLPLALSAEELAHHEGMNAWCVTTWFWIAAVAAFLFAAARTRIAALATGGCRALWPVAALGFVLFTLRVERDMPIFANLRFLTCAAAVAAAYGCALMLRFPRWAGEPGKEQSLWVGVGATLFLFVLLSFEPFEYCLRTVEDKKAMQWSSLMSLTLVWSLFAASLLLYGFRMRTRPWRIAALALFGVTGLKLVLVDLAGIEQGYRIISFFVMGSLMLGASYLYHKLEKRLEAACALDTPRAPR
jgi:uncharacterized membrane protein